MPLKVNPEWKATFLGHQFACRSIQGPLELCRMVDTQKIKKPRGDGHPYWYGEYWLLASVFWRVVDAKAGKNDIWDSRELRLFMRDRCAILPEWSDLTLLVQMDIPAGVSAEFAVGTAAAQGTFRGGFTQYCIDADSLASLNEYMTPPIPLMVGRMGHA